MEEKFGSRNIFSLRFNGKTKHRAGKGWTGIITEIILTQFYNLHNNNMI